MDGICARGPQELEVPSQDHVDRSTSDFDRKEPPKARRWLRITSMHQQGHIKCFEVRGLIGLILLAIGRSLSIQCYEVFSS